MRGLTEALTSRQIASFFLGILFAASVYYFICSPTFVSISRRIFNRTSRQPSHIESTLGTIDKTPSSLESTNYHLDPLALIFILNLVYITTSATRFASLLAFSSRAGTVACTFLIAWGTLGKLVSQFSPRGLFFVIDPIQNDISLFFT
jgi:hypothetical protein